MTPTKSNPTVLIDINIFFPSNVNLERYLSRKKKMKKDFISNLSCTTKTKGSDTEDKFSTISHKEIEKKLKKDVPMLFIPRFNKDSQRSSPQKKTIKETKATSHKISFENHKKASSKSKYHLGYLRKRTFSIFKNPSYEPFDLEIEKKRLKEKLLKSQSKKLKSFWKNKNCTYPYTFKRKELIDEGRIVLEVFDISNKFIKDDKTSNS